MQENLPAEYVNINSEVNASVVPPDYYYSVNHNRNENEDSFLPNSPYHYHEQIDNKNF